MALFLFFPFFPPKNFTALIPGTTVEILHGDSKNIIQLIINAYNVSQCFFSYPRPHPCPLPLGLRALGWAQVGSAQLLLYLAMPPAS